MILSIWDVHKGNPLPLWTDPHGSGLLLAGPLIDKVVDLDSENVDMIFGVGIGGIKDLTWSID